MDYLHDIPRLARQYVAGLAHNILSPKSPATAICTALMRTGALCTITLLSPWAVFILMSCDIRPSASLAM